MEVNHRINLFGANATTQKDIPLYSIDHPYNLLAGEKAALLMEMDMAKRVALSREELFDQVWRKPVREVAVELGVSDVGLAKKCRRNGIPLPPQGYWLRSNSTLNPGFRPELPALTRGQMETFTFLIEDVAPGGTPTKEARVDVLSFLQSADVAAAMRHPEVVALTQRFKKSINRGSLDERGIMRFPGELPWAIRTSKQQADRSLALLHGIHARLHLLGYTFRLDEKRQTMVCFKAEGSDFWLWIEEHATRQERQLSAKELREKQDADASGRYFWTRDKWVYTPSGKLNVKIDIVNWKYPIKTWSDGAQPNLEGRLDGIAADIAVIAVEARIKAENQALEAAAEEAARLDRQKELLRIKHENLKRKQLLREARNWVTAVDLRRYIEAVSVAPLTAFPNLENGQQREAWVAWAKETALAIDPISSGNSATVPPLPELPLLSWDDY